MLWSIDVVWKILAKTGDVGHCEEILQEALKNIAYSIFYLISVVYQLYADQMFFHPVIKILYDS